MDAATKAKSEKRVVYVGTSVFWPGGRWDGLGWD